jgi:hypothetical protein
MNTTKRYSIKKAENVTGWIIQKEDGLFVAKNNNFRRCFSEKKLSELVRSLTIWNKELELYNRGY